MAHQLAVQYTAYGQSGAEYDTGLPATRYWCDQQIRFECSCGTQGDWQDATEEGEMAAVEAGQDHLCDQG